MIEYIKDVHGFEDRNITVLMDDGEHREPTRDNILKHTHSWFNRVRLEIAATVIILVMEESSEMMMETKRMAMMKRSFP